MVDNKNKHIGSSPDKGTKPEGKGVKEDRSINPDAGMRGKPRRELLSVDEFVAGIENGSRATLSRAITLVESTRPEHREKARAIIERCVSDTKDTARIAITGVPGVGKSSFIEALGNHVLDKGHRLAVLSIDPSSTRSRGSILGDKTRMKTLANSTDAFIRPSPTGGSLGGVARKTRETIYLCEAAGFDIIFIETVGVGQSETAAHSMVDFFLLLMLAGAGDELQGMKRGIMEMADVIAINKIDEAPEQAVGRAMRAYRNALHLQPAPKSGWKTEVTTCSAITSEGIAEIWERIQTYVNLTRGNGYFKTQRNRQAKHWMYETIESRLKGHFFGHPQVKRKQSVIERKVLKGELSSFQAARQLWDLYEGS